jgi:hypothetical protein
LLEKEGTMMMKYKKVFALFGLSLLFLGINFGACTDTTAARTSTMKSITIKLGTGLNGETFPNVIEESGGHVSHWAKKLLGQNFTVSETETDLDLVIVSVADLGFEHDATLEQIYARAQGFGLGICPAEVGPQLRLQYTHQPYGEWLLIGMEPIKDLDDNPIVFSVAYDGDGLWIDGDNGHVDNFWSDDVRWVFVRK